jgi:hypothetical protein
MPMRPSAAAALLTGGHDHVSPYTAGYDPVITRLRHRHSLHVITSADPNIVSGGGVGQQGLAVDTAIDHGYGVGRGRRATAAAVMGYAAAAASLFPCPPPRRLSMIDKHRRRVSLTSPRGAFVATAGDSQPDCQTCDAAAASGSADDVRDDGGAVPGVVEPDEAPAPPELVCHTQQQTRHHHHPKPQHRGRALVLHKDSQSARAANAARPGFAVGGDEHPISRLVVGGLRNPFIAPVHASHFLPPHQGDALWRLANNNNNNSGE